MLLAPSRAFKYLVRPDGTIRVCTKGSVKREESDTLVEMATFFPPGDYVYDFVSKTMVPDTQAKKAERRANAPQLGEDPAVERARKLATLRDRVASLPPREEEAFHLLGQLLGLDI